MYNLIKYSVNYSKTSQSLWQYYRDKLHDTAIVNSKLLKSNTRITGKTPAASNTKDLELAVPLKLLRSNLLRTLAVPVINRQLQEH